MPALTRQNASILSWPLDPKEGFLYTFLDPCTLAEHLQMQVSYLSLFFSVHKHLQDTCPAYCAYYSNWMAAIDFYVKEIVCERADAMPVKSMASEK